MESFITERMTQKDTFLFQCCICAHKTMSFTIYDDDEDKAWLRHRKAVLFDIKEHLKEKHRRDINEVLTHNFKINLL